MTSARPAALIAATAAVGGGAFSAAAAGVAGGEREPPSSSLLENPPPRRRSAMPYLRPDDLRILMGDDYDPVRASNWVSVSEDVEFLPVLDSKKIKVKKNKKAPEAGASGGARSLAEQNEGEATTGAWDNYDPYSVQPFQLSRRSSRRSAR